MTVYSAWLARRFQGHEVSGSVPGLIEYNYQVAAVRWQAMLILNCRPGVRITVKIGRTHYWFLFTARVTLRVHCFIHIRHFHSLLLEIVFNNWGLSIM